MNKALVVLGLAGGLVVGPLTLRLGAAPGSPPQHRVVFELTSDDREVWEGVLNNAQNVQNALGPSSIEIVAHGKGLAMLTASKSGALQQRMQQGADGGLTFMACENTMRRQNVKKEDLVPFAKTVDSGVAEVVRKQESGWAYVRSGI